MKKIIYISMLSLFSISNSSYLIRYGDLETKSIKFVVKETVENENWTEIQPEYSQWINDGERYDCLNWSPLSNTIKYGEKFIQSANDCKQNQIRNVQRMESENTTGEIRNKGDSTIEYSVLTNQLNSREEIGSLENWTPIGKLYTEWVNEGELYDCTNWMPSTNDIDSGVNFEQNATDCKQDQTRTAQNREQGDVSFEIRNTGDLITENQTIPEQVNIRNSVGTKSIGYTHYRIFIFAPVSARYAQIVEAELLDSSGQDLFDLYTVQTSESSLNSDSYKADKTIDNLFGNNKWTSKPGLQFNSWVAYNFPVAVLPKNLTITNYTSTSESSRQPKDFAVQYSNDGVSWTTMKSFSEVSTWDANEKKTFNLE